MKIVILLGRGVEGCGVTKHTIELMAWLKKNNHFVITYATKTKKYTRGDSHQHDIIETKFYEENTLAEIVNACNNADYVVVNSFPAVKYVKREIDAFNKIIGSIKTKIIIIQHDHNIISIKRNACMNETVAKAHIIYTHSTSNSFVEYIRELGYTIPIKKFQPGFNFEQIRQTHWKPITMQDTKIHRWIGRATPWKGINAFFDLHNNYLRQAGNISIMEGIERSLYYSDLCTGGKWDFEDYTREYYKYNDITFEPNKRVYMLAHYNNTEMLERMSLSGFGYQLTTMKPRFVEQSIEYTHCEIAACGTTSVFRKSFGDLCVHRKQSLPLTQCKNTGTIWLDDKDMSKAFNTIKQLSLDNVMRDEWRNMAYEFYREHQGTGDEFNELFGLQTN